MAVDTVGRPCHNRVTTRAARCRGIYAPLPRSGIRPHVYVLSLPTFSPQILQFACQFCTADESVEAFPTARRS